MATIYLFRAPLPTASRFREPTHATPRSGWPPREPLRPSIRAAIREGWRRWRSRTAISELDPYILKDIGVTWVEAEHEANKPFWRA